MPSNATLSDIGEFGLIERIRGLLEQRTAVVGIGDDAAVLPFSDEEYLLATTDTLVEDVHFRRAEISPHTLGRRSLAVNVSDIAAMAGRPTFALTSITAPADTPVHFIEELYRGISDEAAAFEIAVVGGNVSQTAGPLTIDVALLGLVPRNEVALRSGAQVGDALAVTGYLGKAAARRMRREQEDGPGGKDTLVPTPRVTEARALASAGLIHAMLDLSDGLASDAQHMARAGAVGLVLYEEQLPIAIQARSASASLGLSESDLALFGGEDYELLIALPEDAVEVARSLLADTQLAVIGTVLARDQGCLIERSGGRRDPLLAAGWTHF